MQEDYVADSEDEQMISFPNTVGILPLSNSVIPRAYAPTELSSPALTTLTALFDAQPPLELADNLRPMSAEERQVDPISASDAPKQRPRPRPIFKGAQGTPSGSSATLVNLPANTTTDTTIMATSSTVAQLDGFSGDISERTKMRKRAASQKKYPTTTEHISVSDEDELDLIADAALTHKEAKTSSKPDSKCSFRSELGTLPVPSSDPNISLGRLLSSQLPPSDPLPPPSTGQATHISPSPSPGPSRPSKAARRRAVPEFSSDEENGEVSSKPVSHPTRHSPQFFIGSSQPDTDELPPVPAPLPPEHKSDKERSRKSNGNGLLDADVVEIVDAPSIPKQKRRSKAELEDEEGWDESAAKPKKKKATKAKATDAVDDAGKSKPAKSKAKKGKANEEPQLPSGRPSVYVEVPSLSTVLRERASSPRPILVHDPSTDELTPLSDSEGEGTLFGREPSAKSEGEKGPKLPTPELPPASPPSSTRKRKATDEGGAPPAGKKGRQKGKNKKGADDPPAIEEVITPAGKPKSKAKAPIVLSDEEGDAVQVQSESRTSLTAKESPHSEAPDGVSDTTPTVHTPAPKSTPGLSARSHTLTSRTKSTPMSDLIRRVNSLPGSPFSSSRSARPGVLAKNSRSTLMRIAPLHANRRTPPPPPPPPPKPKKTKKQLQMEERWEEELSETVEGWAAMTDEERAALRRAKRDFELGVD